FPFESAREISECVGSGVSIVFCVRELASADTVEDDPDNAVEMRHGGVIHELCGRVKGAAGLGKSGQFSQRKNEENLSARRILEITQTGIPARLQTRVTDTRLGTLKRVPRIRTSPVRTGSPSTILTHRAHTWELKGKSNLGGLTIISGMP